jgi:hypothetical protein
MTRKNQLLSTVVQEYENDQMVVPQKIRHVFCQWGKLKRPREFAGMVN